MSGYRLAARRFRQPALRGTPHLHSTPYPRAGRQYWNRNRQRYPDSREWRAGGPTGAIHHPVYSVALGPVPGFYPERSRPRPARTSDGLRQTPPWQARPDRGYNAPGRHWSRRARNGRQIQRRHNRPAGSRQHRGYRKAREISGQHQRPSGSAVSRRSGLLLQRLQRRHGNPPCRLPFQPPEESSWALTTGSGTGRAKIPANRFLRINPRGAGPVIYPVSAIQPWCIRQLWAFRPLR